jgi:hypothetical protein
MNQEWVVMQQSLNGMALPVTITLVSRLRMPCTFAKQAASDSAPIRAKQIYGERAPVGLANQSHTTNEIITAPPCTSSC